MKKTIAKSVKPKLLAGGNPQIAKADGEEPVRQYISAVNGWKSTVVKRIDRLISSNVRGVEKAVRWNSPMYGLKGKGWFVSYHVFTNYVKVTFFKGASLNPIPPGGTSKEARWIDVHESDLDEEQLIQWIIQAAAIDGWGK